MPVPPRTQILILGLGWQGNFLRQVCKEQNVNCQATTTTGRDNTIPFRFDAMNPSEELFDSLPDADTIVITFPLDTIESPSIFIKYYKLTHSNSNSNLIVYGSTRAWHGVEGNPWTNKNGPLTPDNRYKVEEKIISFGGCVLNLAGLWGANRHPKNWIPRVANSKESLEQKDSLHLIHGLDVARLTLKVAQQFTHGRWLVTDMRVYDWWELVMSFGDDKYKNWVLELISNEKSLPRQHSEMARCIDSVETWTKFGILPLESLYQK
jgi:hypothetical protein